MRINYKYNTSIDSVKDERGIAYDELSEEDKAAYESTFAGENGERPERIQSSALNEWVFNEDTIREVLHILTSNGLRIDCGETLGKTIIFAKSHAHAEKIYEVFNLDVSEVLNLVFFKKAIDRVNANAAA